MKKLVCILSLLAPCSMLHSMKYILQLGAYYGNLKNQEELDDALILAVNYHTTCVEVLVCHGAPIDIWNGNNQNCSVLLKVAQFVPLTGLEDLLLNAQRTMLPVLAGSVCWFPCQKEVDKALKRVKKVFPICAQLDLNKACHLEKGSLIKSDDEEIRDDLAIILLEALRKGTHTLSLFSLVPHAKRYVVDYVVKRIKQDCRVVAADMAIHPEVRALLDPATIEEVCKDALLQDITKRVNALKKEKEKPEKDESNNNNE